MKKDNDSQTQLNALRSSLAKIKTLLAWLQLKRLEVRGDVPPAFVMCDSAPADLRNELLFFTLASQQLHAIVNDKATHLSIGKRTIIKAELAQLNEEFDSLDIPSDFECGTRCNPRFKNGINRFF